MVEHYCVVAWDAPDGGEKRRTNRAAHFAHIEAVMDKVAVAGPLLDDEGAMIGSLLLIKAANRSDAEAIVKMDPYCIGGVWDRWDIHPFRAAAGEWIGGKTW